MLKTKSFNLTFRMFRKSSAIFGKCSENARKRSSGAWNHFGKSSESGRKSSENRQKRRHRYVNIIHRILHAHLWIRILTSRVQLDISRVSAANECDIELNTRT